MSVARRDEEMRAACVAAGRAVGAALLGFTLETVSILPRPDESGVLRPAAALGLDHSSLGHEEQVFLILAGTWAQLDGVEFSREPQKARARILEAFPESYPEIDREKTSYGLALLIDDYGQAVRALSRELLERKTMSGAECGEVILRNRPAAGRE